MAKNHWDETTVAVCKEMGRQWRQRWHGEIPQKYGGGNQAKGYPVRSLLGKLKEEGIEGASQSRAVQDQFLGEAFTRDALVGRRVIAEKLNDQEKLAIEAHFFVVGLPVKLKAHTLGWKVSTYWWRLNRAMQKLSLGLRSVQEVSH